MLKYGYDLIKSNVKKYILYQILIIVLNFILVKGCAIFLEEETGYLLVFPVLLMQLIILLQYTILFLFYQNEIFEKDLFFADKFIVKERNSRQYHLKQCQLYNHEIIRFCIGCILFVLISRQMEVFSMFICINGMGVLIENYLYTERWIKKYEEAGNLIWKKISSGAILICALLIFEFPNMKMGFIIVTLFVIHTIANKKYIRSR